MSTTLILSIVGADRPGLVEAVAAAVSAAGGNWLESRLARLGGQFAGVARVTVPAAAEAGLRTVLGGLATQGLAVSVAADAPAGGAPAAGLRAHLELVGQDRPGIVSQVSAVLARSGANVEDFRSVVESAPMSGDALFRCEAEVVFKDPAHLHTVRRALEQLAGDLMVDIGLSSR